MNWFKRFWNVMRPGRMTFLSLRPQAISGVSTNDAITVGGVVVIVLAVSVVASLIPAIRAARAEPMQALREE
jgi:ABC-type antimicrobial peptide transport system permease subunit